MDRSALRSLELPANLRDSSVPFRGEVHDARHRDELVAAHVSQHVAAVTHAYESRIFNPPVTKS
jgi:hypothetical protein